MKANKVTWRKFCVTFLTDKCVRVEENQKLSFVDAPSHTFVNREIESVALTIDENDDFEIISSSSLSVKFNKNEKLSNNFEIYSKDGEFSWKSTDKAKSDLAIDGFDHGFCLISSLGFSVFDDSSSQLITKR